MFGTTRFLLGLPAALAAVSFAVPASEAAVTPKPISGYGHHRSSPHVKRSHMNPISGYHPKSV